MDESDFQILVTLSSRGSKLSELSPMYWFSRLLRWCDSPFDAKLVSNSTNKSNELQEKLNHISLHFESSKRIQLLELMRKARKRQMILFSTRHTFRMNEGILRML